MTEASEGGVKVVARKHKASAIARSDANASHSGKAATLTGGNCLHSTLPTFL